MDDAAMVTAMHALVWVISDQSRADRLLALTGLDADDLRARLGDPALHIAVIDFLTGHEPDLVACADALHMPVAELAALGQRLGAPPPA